MYIAPMLMLGQLRIDALEDGRFALDGGAMFGIVPRPLWEKRFAPDELNRVPLAARCLLVRAAGRVALVDTGMGERWQPAERERYGIERTRTVLGDLAALGLGPEDVTDVVLTHLHFDHAGGVARRDGATLALTFPRARHHVQRRGWDWARKPSARDRGSFRVEDFALLEGSDRLALVEGEKEIFPGLHAFPSEGHTPALQCVRIESEGRTLFYPADLIPTSAHLKLAWGMSYDLQPLRIVEEKKALLAEAVQRGAILVFEHDPHLAACSVRAQGDEFVVDREVAL